MSSMLSAESRREEPSGFFVAILPFRGVAQKLPLSVLLLQLEFHPGFSEHNFQQALVWIFA